MSSQRAMGADSASDQLNRSLAAADLANGITAMSAELASNPGNDELRFAMGLLHFIRGVERLGQSLHHCGLKSADEFAGGVPFLRLPIPPNPNPEAIDYEAARGILEAFLADMAQVEAALAPITGDSVKLDLYFGRARLDFNSDGVGSDEEALWRTYAALNPMSGVSAEQAEQFLIRLDAGDVQWLRAYAHLLSGMLEFYLAFDHSRLFDHAAHLFFRKPQSTFPFLTQGPEGDFAFLVVDAISLIHLIDFPVKDPARAEAARKHFLETIALSRKSWDLYSQETDDDREWIPNPNQTGVIPGVAVTAEMVQQWQAVLGEVEAVLSGEKLVPFWRGTPGVGVNLSRVFTEPRRFDLVLWIQGTAAAPYLEQGELTNPEFWRQIQTAFNGQFLGFAVWFN